MPTTKKYLTRIPNGGFDRAFLPHASKPEEFYDLLQFRPLVGGLQQTAPVVQKQALSLLAGDTMDVGGTPTLKASQTEFLTIAQDTGGNLKYLLLNQATARYVDPANLATQTEIPAIWAGSLSPLGGDAWSQCLLYGFNTTDFATLYDEFDVQIVDTSHFQWRKNGGSWSASLPIAAATAIGSGLTVSFMVDTGYTGFTPGTVWNWERLDRANPLVIGVPALSRPMPSTTYLKDVYIANVGSAGYVKRVRDGFITDVGYGHPTFGKYVEIFASHLVVGQAYGVYIGTTPANAPWTVAWSHLNDPDQMVPTQNNEADSYLIPYSAYSDAVNLGITGMKKMYSSLYIYLPDAIYQMNYVGLPNVMQTTLVWDSVGSFFPFGLVNSKKGHYFIARDNFYNFIGFRPTPIGEPVREKFFGEIVSQTDPYFQQTFGYYDAARQEVIWTYWTKVGTYYQARQVVFMEKYNRWYFRNIPSVDSGATNLTALCPIYGDPSRMIYGGLGYLYTDYNGELPATIATDFASSSPVYTPPYAVTNDLYYQDIFFQKEADTLYIDAGWYASVTGVQASVSARQLLSSGVYFQNANQLWTPSIAEGKVGLPKPSTHGRILRFQFTFVPATGYCPIGCMLNAWGDNNYERAAER